MFRHPSEPLEPNIRCVVHTHLYPGWLVRLPLRKSRLKCSHGPFCIPHCSLNASETERMWTFYSLSSLFFLHSHCWMSQTPTAQPIARLHSSIRKTRGSMRRGWRPSWSRAGWTSELLSRSSPSSPSTPLHHPSTSVFHSYLIEKGKIATLSEELKCHPEKKGRMKQPNQNGR